MLKETILIKTFEFEGECNKQEHIDKAFELFKKTRIYNSDRTYISIVKVYYAVTNAEKTSTEIEFHRVMM